jgi:mannose-1-phosphate guanylyltransferase/mannose-1-phosphate guanylyltransferase/mannose-6-phosphate isomerase
MMRPQIIPVILSGGAGSRLWPLSTVERPKQLHALTAPSTMLQMTAERVRDDSRFSEPVVVASERHLSEIETQLQKIMVVPQLTIVEPVARNTAAAIALAALEADPSALLLVMPSDHVIARPDRFLAAVEAAAPHAQDGRILTFGIPPESPETGYGYIKRGRALGGGVYDVDRFVEKPDEAAARAFLKEGSYCWNGGIFLFRADRLCSGLDAHAPDIIAGVRSALAGARRWERAVRPDHAKFASVRSQSIDHALMELDSAVAVVPVEMGWSDVGSWDALFAIAEKDGNGNSTSGDVHAGSATDCLIHSAGPQIMASGVKDLIVVATADAVLILPRGEAQRVKQLVEVLRGPGKPAV